ncbi:hypothetical protein TNCV_1608971 [Trichonephila clavipes]|nr:hypothetical protein TNCV_1608971 [Trichonephila clavipes]
MTCCAVLLEPQLLDIMIVQFRNEKVSNQGSIPITIDCNVVAFIVFEEGFHQPIKRTKQPTKLRDRDRRVLLKESSAHKRFVTKSTHAVPLSWFKALRNRTIWGVEKGSLEFTMDYFDDNWVNRMDWSALSVDLNPIEDLWKDFDRRIKVSSKRPKSEKELACFFSKPSGRKYRYPSSKHLWKACL